MTLINGSIPVPVGPGDLIRAGDYNALVFWLRELEDRVVTLEGADESVAITAILPAGPIRIGDTIEIIGRNFGFIAGTHRVYFNSSRATIFSSDSGDNRLVVTVPFIPGVSPQGTQVTLTVGNLVSVDTTEVTVRPAVEQQEGSLGMLFTGLTVDGTAVTAVTPDSLVHFNYNLESDALLPATVSISPSISIPDWQNRLEVFDDEGNLLTSRQITLDPGEQTTFSVRLDVPVGSENTTFTLATTADASGLPRVENSQTFTVGEPITPIDPTVTNFTVSGARPPAAVVGATITIANGETVNVQLQAEFTGPPPGEQYVYTFSVDEPAAPWAVAVPSTFPPFSAPVTFTVTGPDVQNVSFDVSLTGATSTSSAITARLQRDEGGQTLEVTQPFTLQSA